MRYHRSDVVERALVLLDTVGLPDLSMRRLAGDLGVQPSALYHHVANKQTLLGLMADELLTRVEWPAEERWVDQLAATCESLHRTLLEVRDGAELVATAWSFGLGAGEPATRLEATLSDAGLGEVSSAATQTLLHFVYGHALHEQTARQAAAAGAIEPHVPGAEFSTGLAMVIAGVQVIAQLGAAA